MAYKDKNDPRKRASAVRYSRSVKGKAKQRARYLRDRAAGKRYRFDKAKARQAKARYNAKHPDRVRKDGADRRVKYHQFCKAYVEEYRQSHPCIDCGEKDPRVLDFDHRDHTAKKAAISELLKNHSTSPQKLKREIEKCDVRCANCHRKKTADERRLWCNKRKKSIQPSAQLSLFDFHI